MDLRAYLGARASFRVLGRWKRAEVTILRFLGIGTPLVANFLAVSAFWVVTEGGGLAKEGKGRCKRQMLGWMDGAVERLTFIGHFAGVFWSGREGKGMDS